MFVNECKIFVPILKKATAPIPITKGPGDGVQPGPNNRVSGLGDQGHAVLKITFAELCRSCS